VNYIDSYLVDGVLWVVMEFMDGSDLTSVIEACAPFKESEIATICREVCQATRYFLMSVLILVVEGSCWIGASPSKGYHSQRY